MVLPAETAMPRIILGVPFRGRRLVRGTTRPGGGSHGARRVDSIRPCDGVRLMLLSAVTGGNGRPGGRIDGTSPGAGECPKCWSGSHPRARRLRSVSEKRCRGGFPRMRVVAEKTYRGEDAMKDT